MQLHSCLNQIVSLGTRAMEFRGLHQRPVVSVVIPTRNRPELVARAVRSALAQTLADIEVIVVIDGIDRDTVKSLAAITDHRGVTICLPISVGGAEARNVGIRQSHGRWIALLDDDDEWSPHKLARQVHLGRISKKRFPVVTCRLIARRPAGDELWPARKIRSDESMSEYLLCRESSIRQGEGFIQTSTLLMPRELMLQIPFECGLPRHQDWDWLIRASVCEDVEFLWVWDPLVTYHISGLEQSVSAGRSLQASVDWVNSNQLVTPKARAYFYATQVAARCQTPATFWSIVRNTMRYPRALVIALGLALAPRNLVDRLRPRSIFTHA
jgi:glycosyltransferase involved in cell wall biosynthesis